MCGMEDKSSEGMADVKEAVTARQSFKHGVAFYCGKVSMLI